MRTQYHVKRPQSTIHIHRAYNLAVLFTNTFFQIKLLTDGTRWISGRWMLLASTYLSLGIYQGQPDGLFHGLVR